MTVSDIAPVSVVVPTIGRRRRLEACLKSLSECKPRAAEIVVVDQSDGDGVANIVERFAHVGARVIESQGHSPGLARNQGLNEARHEIVLITDDDCTVSPSWIGAAWGHMAGNQELIVTGRVLPAGDPRAVPATIDNPLPHDYTGEVHCGALFTGNMACSCSAVLALGGFDERVAVADDNDFCYRWLRAGHALRYEPDLVVWHHDWRTQEQLEQLYVTYAQSMGLFYAKHLRQGDLTVLRFIARDFYSACRGTAARIIRRRPRWADWRQGVLRGLPVGLIRGWRLFKPERDLRAT